MNSSVKVRQVNPHAGNMKLSNTSFQSTRPFKDARYGIDIKELEPVKIEFMNSNTGSLMGPEEYFVVPGRQGYVELKPNSASDMTNLRSLVILNHYSKIQKLDFVDDAVALEEAIKKSKTITELVLMVQDFTDEQVKEACYRVSIAVPNMSSPELRASLIHAITSRPMEIKEKLDDPNTKAYSLLNDAIAFEVVRRKTGSNSWVITAKCQGLSQKLYPALDLGVTENAVADYLTRNDLIGEFETVINAVKANQQAKVQAEEKPAKKTEAPKDDLKSIEKLVLKAIQKGGVFQMTDESVEFVATSGGWITIGTTQEEAYQYFLTNSGELERLKSLAK